MGFTARVPDLWTDMSAERILGAVLTDLRTEGPVHAMRLSQNRVPSSVIESGLVSPQQVHNVLRDPRQGHFFSHDFEWTSIGPAYPEQCGG
jgi:hypothetical protein